MRARQRRKHPAIQQERIVANSIRAPPRLAKSPSASPPGSISNARSKSGAAATPPRLSRSPGSAGRIFFGAPISRSRRTACSPSPAVSYSLGCSRYSPRSPPLCRCTVCSPILEPSTPISSSRRDFFPARRSISFASRWRASSPMRTRRSDLLSSPALLVALWSANAGMKAIIDALNVIYGEREKRGFVTLTLVALAFTLGIICFMLAAVALVIALPIVFNTIGLAGYSEALAARAAMAGFIGRSRRRPCLALSLWAEPQ